MKKIKILIILLIISTIVHTQVLASSFELDAKTDKNIVKKGEEISIYLEITDIQSITGVNVVQGNFEYNHDILEFEKAEKLNNWNFTYNDENDGKFIAMILSKGETEQKSIGKITFKVKQNTNETNCIIKIKNIVSSDEEEKIKTKDKEITIEIEDLKKSNTSLNTKEKKKNNIMVISIISLTTIFFIIIYVLVNKLKN